MSKPKQYVGLDIGLHSLKAVWVERSGAGVAVVRREELRLPPETQDPVQQLIVPWLDKNGLQRTPTAIAVPGTQVVYQAVTLPKDDPRTVEQAADMELSSFNDMAGERMKHCSTAFEWMPGVRQMLMAMVRPSVEERALRGADGLGLRLHDLVPSPIPAFNAAMRTNGARPSPTLVVNVGHGTTELCVGTAQGLLFARAFAGGGKAMTDALHRARGGSPAQLERLKAEEAGLDAGNPFAETLRAPAQVWISQVRSAMAVYRGQFAGEAFAIGNIVLTGGGAKLRGLADLVSSSFGIPAAVMADATVPPEFATAFGLALASSASSRVCPLSLLPQQRRDEIVFREKKPYWIAAGFCVALALAVFIGSGIRGIARERRTAELERQRIAVLTRIDQSIKSIRAAEEATRALAEPLWPLLQSGPLARELVTLVANSIHPDDWIILICDEEVYLPPEPTNAAPARATRNLRSAPRPNSGPSLRVGDRGGKATGVSAPRIVAEAEKQRFLAFIIEGYTPRPDLVTVRELIGRLRASPLVTSADVLGDERVLPAAVTMANESAGDLAGGLTHFVVRVEVNRP